jgi:MerR family redox-sensitive transcriptional activator SoxR
VKKPASRISIGAVASRTGLSVPAIRYYETQNLVRPIRTSGGQRMFLRSDIRRLSFVLIAQQIGFTLDEIRVQLESLPQERTPTKRDWTRISQAYRQALQDRMDLITRLQDKLDGCIGCGCLSLANCSLYNPDDQARKFGDGPRYLLGDKIARKA